VIIGNNKYIYKYTHTILCMAKKEVQTDVQLGTDPYNVADGYTKLKILKLLYSLDVWDTVAQFGTENLDEEVLMQMNVNQIKKRRVEGLERFLSTTRQLIGNVVFALKKEDLYIIESYKIRIANIQEMMPQLYKVSTGDQFNDEEFEINEVLFKAILLILQEIKDEINTPLNKAGLIFRQSEEMDLDKMMEEIVGGG
jgi:hypothetical protein